MPIDLVPALAGTLGLAALAYGIRILVRQQETRREKGAEENVAPGNDGGKKEKKTLADVSRIWVGKKEVLDFREIARIWRITPVTGQAESPPDYRHPEIAAFHARWVRRPVVKGEKKSVIEGILSLLDQHGDCPSVVQRNGNEAEKKYDPSVFDKLATVPLWRHSLEVAGNLAGKMKQTIMLPDALIAGLGHDLGKIPSYQDALYRTGDHPIVSIIALNRIPGYESLKNREDISLAVRQHHLVKAETPLGADLREADGETRLAEISRLTDGPGPEAEESALEKGETKAAQAGRPANGDSQIPPSPIARQEEPSEGGGIESRLHKLDLDALLLAIRCRVNRLEKGRWSVVSTPDGLVLVQPNELWAQMKKQIGSFPEIQMAEGDEGRKREILDKLVFLLERERKAIATDLLKKGFYTTQVLVVMANGKAMKVPLIPFRVEAFGVLPSALECLKGDVLKGMVKKIKTVRDVDAGKR